MDDTPVHKALREALANCLINADYHGVRGVVIRKETDKINFANPGYVRTGKKQMRLGGESDPRNKSLMKMFNLINIGERAGSGVPNIFNVWNGESDPRNKSLMKMFNLINIGERAGSGVPNIFNVWNDEGFVEPEIEERFDPDRTILTLSFSKKATKKSDEKKATKKSDGKRVTKKRQEQYEKILTFMQPDVWYKASDLMNVLGVKETRTKELLRALITAEKLVDDGATKGKRYKKVDEL